MTKNEERVRAWGLYFGYPQCCVDEFIAGIEKGFAARSSIVKENSSCGFVPCKPHAKLLDTKKTTLGAVIKDRICERPLQHADDQEMDFKWLDGYFKSK